MTVEPISSYKLLKRSHIRLGLIGNCIMLSIEIYIFTFDFEEREGVLGLDTNYEHIYNFIIMVEEGGGVDLGQITSK